MSHLMVGESAHGKWCLHPGMTLQSLEIGATAISANRIILIMLSKGADL